VVSPSDPLAEVKGVLRDIARLDQRTSVPDAVEARVLRVWDERAVKRSARRAPRKVWWIGAAAAAVAAACVATVLVVRRESHETPRAVDASRPPDTLDSYLRWLDDDPSSLQVVRLRATRATLSSLGVAVPGIESDGPFDIELVVGPDGARRGARLLLPTRPGEF
jgi:hypothetical protein